LLIAGHSDIVVDCEIVELWVLGEIVGISRFAVFSFLFFPRKKNEDYGFFGVVNVLNDVVYDRWKVKFLRIADIERIIA